LKAYISAKKQTSDIKGNLKPKGGLAHASEKIGKGKASPSSKKPFAGKFFRAFLEGLALFLAEIFWLQKMCSGGRRIGRKKRKDKKKKRVKKRERE